MGGLVSGIFDLASGDPTGKEQSQFGGLSTQQIGAGESAQTAAETYFNNMLTDPTKALAPEISAGQNQVEQQRLQDANFGNRSGGTNASTQNAEGAERGNIINLMGNEQGSAASALGTLGTSQVSEGSNALGNEADLADQRRQQVNQDVGGIAQGAAEIVAALAGGGGSDSGADPYQTLYNAQHPDPNSIQTTPDTSLDNYQIPLEDQNQQLSL